MNDELRNAKSIYKDTLKISTIAELIQKIKQDFAVFKKSGIQNDDFERVLKLLVKKR
jgi:hypothetical protein